MIAIWNMDDSTKKSRQEKPKLDHYMTKRLKRWKVLGKI
jgi:hypothetical protein